MKLVLFYHSLASDWNHGNAHFLRGGLAGERRQWRAIGHRKVGDFPSLRHGLILVPAPAPA